MSTRERWTLAAAVLGSAIVFLDSTIVTVALPRIGQELSTTLFGTLEGQSYVYNAYLLTLSALLVLAGALNDYYGRRRIFSLGLVGFGGASILCGLAPSMELLVLFRVLQGAAGAMLVPGSLSLIAAAFSGEQQGRAYGIWSGASAGTTILGPFVGGLLVDTVSWRMAFLVNAPVVALALWAVRRHVTESRDEAASGRFDWVGAAVAALAVGGLSFGAIYGQQREWRAPLAFVALGVGATAAAVFPFLMAQSAHPLVPLDLFRSRNFTVINVSTVLIYGALYVVFAYLTLFLQGTLGYTAAAAGLAVIPGFLLLALFSSRFGALAAKRGPRSFMAAGPAIMAAGVLWLARVPADSEAWRLRPNDVGTFLPPYSYLVDVLPAMVVFGSGLMLLIAPLTATLMASVPVRHAGVASAINNALSRAGPQLAGALVFIAITAAFYRGMAERLPGVDVSSPELRQQISPLNAPAPEVREDLRAAARAASADAVHLAATAAAGLLLAGAAVNGIGIRGQREGGTAPQHASGRDVGASDGARKAGAGASPVT